MQSEKRQSDSDGGGDKTPPAEKEAESPPPPPPPPTKFIDAPIPKVRKVKNDTQPNGTMHGPSKY